MRTESDPPRRSLIAALIALPFAGKPASAEAQSDLALACYAAIRQAAYINTASQPEDWSDGRLKEEGDRYDHLFMRAITEPSQGLNDVKAKAQLLLDDVERHLFPFTADAENTAAEADLQDDERLIRVVLREIISLSA